MGGGGNGWRVVGIIANDMPSVWPTIIKRVHQIDRVGENVTTWRATQLCTPHHTRDMA